MKKLLLVFCIFCFITEIQAQNNFFYTSVVNVDSSLSKLTLFKNSQLWFINSFKDSKEVIQFSDTEKGEIIGKGSFKSFTNDGTYCGDINFTVSLFVKDGKYKYEFKDFYHDGAGSSFCSYGYLNNPQTSFMCAKLYLKQILLFSDAHMKDIIKSLDIYMVKNSNNEW